MSVLSRSIARERWEVASLCLLIGLLREALDLPEEAYQGLLSALEVENAREG